MYRINPLPRKVLITTDEVIRMGPLPVDSADPKALENAIIIAEERFIKPALCSELYYDFRDKKNVLVDGGNKTTLEQKINADNTGEPVVLAIGQMVNAIEEVGNSDYINLWNEHLWKVIAECVVYIATPVNYLKFTTQGEMLNNPKSLIVGNEGSNAVSAERKDVQWKLDKLMQDRIDPLIESMKSWLCENKKKFQYFNCFQCPCDENNSGVSYKRKTAWIHGIYDKPKTCCTDE